MQDRNYTSMLAELRNADAGSFAELVLRFIILTTGFSFIAFWHKDMNVVYWYAFYGTLHFFYIQALLKHAEPVSLTTYRSFVFVGVVAILSLDFMILYLWQTGDPICRFGAVGLLIGHGMFSLARHRKLRDLLIADGLSISATTLGIAALLGLEFNSFPILFGCLFIGFLVSAHFLGTLHEGYVEQQEILAARAIREREERLRTIGQLTAGVAHDFNNTMTAVLGHLELYALSKDPSEQREFVAAARMSANRAVELTQQLLAYTRKAPLDRRLEDLAPLLQEVVHDHNAIYKKLFHKPVSLNIASEAHRLQPFWVDGGRLQSAVANLLRNGAEASGADGTVQLSSVLEVFREEKRMPHGAILPKGVYVAISVTDNGHGIAIEDLEHVTEPFWSTKSHANGSGLGLAMAQGFAEQSGGGLDIRSKPGKGTVVTLRLPYVTETDAIAPD